MWFIYSQTKQYFTGDWNEEKPVWDPDGRNAFQFPTKDQALEAVRTAIVRDQEDKRYPVFTGCRVIEFRAHVIELLKKKGETISEHDGHVWIVFDAGKLSPVIAKQMHPATLLGVPIRLRTTLDQVVR